MAGSIDNKSSDLAVVGGYCTKAVLSYSCFEDIRRKVTFTSGVLETHIPKGRCTQSKRSITKEEF